MGIKLENIKDSLLLQSMKLLETKEDSNGNVVYDVVDSYKSLLE